MKLFVYDHDYTLKSLIDLSEIEIKVIEKIKSEDLTVVQYVNKFFANKPQELHDFLDKEREHLLLSGEFYEQS